MTISVISTVTKRKMSNIKFRNKEFLLDSNLLSIYPVCKSKIYFFMPVMMHKIFQPFWGIQQI